MGVIHSAGGEGLLAIGTKALNVEMKNTDKLDR